MSSLSRFKDLPGSLHCNRSCASVHIVRKMVRLRVCMVCLQTSRCNVCGWCGGPWYCSSACQKVDWANRHCHECSYDTVKEMLRQRELPTPVMRLVLFCVHG